MKNGTYTLKCFYFDSLQVTTGLTESMLTHPSLFALCSSRLGRIDDLVSFYKFTSGKFEEGSNPLLWPAGRATEIHLGHWRNLDYVGSLVREDWLANYPLINLAAWTTDRMLNAGGYGSLKCRIGDTEADWNQVYDLNGVNSVLLQRVDIAQWELKKETPPVGLSPFSGEDLAATLPREHDSVALWEFAGGRSAGLYYEPDWLFMEPLLHQAGPRFNTVRSFDTVVEALWQLALDERTTQDALIKTLKIVEGKDAGNVAHRLLNTIHDTTTIDASRLCWLGE